jgi:hypothetical protein
LKDRVIYENELSKEDLKYMDNKIDWKALSENPAIFEAK